MSRGIMRNVEYATWVTGMVFLVGLLVAATSGIIRAFGSVLVPRL